MAKRSSKFRSLRTHRRTRRGGRGDVGIRLRGGGGRKKMMRTRRRTRRGGALPLWRPFQGGGGRKKMMQTRRRTRRVGGTAGPIMPLGL